MSSLVLPAPGCERGKDVFEMNHGMSQVQSGQQWLRRTAALLTLSLGLLLAACPYQTPKPAKTAEPPKPARPLAVGKAETFEFPSDGRWHASSFMLLNNQVFVMQPLGDSAGLGEQAIRFKVGPVPQMLRAGERVRITMPGPLGFRVDQGFAPGLLGPVTVEIKRVQ